MHRYVPLSRLHAVHQCNVYRSYTVNYITKLDCNANNKNFLLSWATKKRHSKQRDSGLCRLTPDRSLVDHTRVFMRSC